MYYRLVFVVFVLQPVEKIWEKFYSPSPNLLLKVVLKLCVKLDVHDLLLKWLIIYYKLFSQPVVLCT